MEQHNRIEKVFVYGAGGYEDVCFDGRHKVYQQQYGPKTQKNWRLNLDVNVTINTWDGKLNTLIHSVLYNNEDVFLVGQPLKFIGVDNTDEDANRMVYLKGLVTAQPSLSSSLDIRVLDYKIYNLPESDSPHLLYVHADYVKQRLIVDGKKVF